MSACAIIELDTTPPVVSGALSSFVQGTLEIVFAVDEDAVIVGEFIDEDGSRTSGVLSGNSLVFEIGTGIASGMVGIEAVDIVGNRSMTYLPIGQSGGLRFVAVRIGGQFVIKPIMEIQ